MMHSRMTIFAGVLLIGLAVQGAEPVSPPQRQSIYQTDGKGMVRVEEALANAERENRCVLLMVGGNWCGWCHKLHELFKQNREIRSLLGTEYELVTVDCQADKDVIAKWEIKASGYPYLVVLNAAGEKLTEQETGSLEIGSRHDPEKVKAFLEWWKAEPLDAATVFAASLKRAEQEKKRVFFRVGSPWCGWCVRLDKFLAQPPVAKILSKDYVLVKIDQQRMTGAKAVVDKVRKSTEVGGIPWFAFLDAKGQVLVTSTRPGTGNIGFPVDRDTEIAYFVEMLKQTRSKISDEEVTSLVEALIEATPKPCPETEPQSQG